jgi:hypothetical protein
MLLCPFLDICDGQDLGFPVLFGVSLMGSPSFVCPLQTTVLSRFWFFTLLCLHPTLFPRWAHLFLFFFFGGTEVWTPGFTFEKQARYHLIHTCSSFCSSYFGDEVSQTVCPGCPPTMILPISASQVARVIGVSHSAHLSSSIFHGYNQGSVSSLVGLSTGCISGTSNSTCPRIIW